MKTWISYVIASYATHHFSVGASIWLCTVHVADYARDEYFLQSLVYAKNPTKLPSSSVLSVIFVLQGVSILLLMNVFFV